MPTAQPNAGAELDARREKLRQWLDTRPNSDHDVEAVVRELTEMRRIFHEELAQRLQPSFGRWAEAQKFPAYESKQVFLRKANDFLAVLGLGFWDERSQSTGILVSSRRGMERGAFQLEIRDGHGGAAPAWTSAELPPLRLAPRAERLRPSTALTRKLLGQEQPTRHR